MKKNLLVVIVLIFILGACSKHHMNIKVLKPAYITVPKHIQKVVVANRSLPDMVDRASKAGNIIEGVLTGEQIFADRWGSEEAIRGLTMALSRSDRFDVVAPEDLELPGAGAGRFGAYLDWDEVEDICKKYNADGLITLGLFDSDQAKKVERVVREKKVEGRTVKEYIFISEMDMSVTTGWRIYDPKEKRVVDESTFVDHKSFSAEGRNEREANTMLPSNQIAIEETGYFAGDQYSYRICPSWVWVSRFYYKKGHDSFEKAERMASKGEWELAAEIWVELTDHMDEKIAGKACHNMAVAAEMEGDLESALEWAKQAYIDHGNKRSGDYINNIKRRIADQARLKQQLD